MQRQHVRVAKEAPYPYAQTASAIGTGNIFGNIPATKPARPARPVQPPATTLAIDHHPGVNPNYRTRGWKHSHTGEVDWVQGYGARAQARYAAARGQGVRDDCARP